MTDREIMQMALDALELECRDLSGNKIDLVAPAIKALRDRLAQPEPWVKTHCGGKPNYTTAPEPKPVAWMFQHSETGNVTFLDNLTMAKLFGEKNVRWGEAIPLYTAPQKREWVGLTDEEIGGLTVFDGLTHIEVPILADYIRVIEARLREKNT